MREIKEYKVVKIEYRNLPVKKILALLTKKDWALADPFEAYTPEVAAEVASYDHESGEDETMLFAVKERGKAPVIIEVEITMMPEANAYRYKYTRGV